MQTLTLTLPTPVLLVWGGTWSEMAQLCDSPEKIVSYLKSGDSEWINLKGNWQLLEKLEQLTEEQAKELVDSDNEYGVRMFRNYRTTSMPYFDEQIDSLGSFHSAIEAELTGKLMAEDEFLTVDEARSRSKTLPANTLIFKRV